MGRLHDSKWDGGVRLDKNCVLNNCVIRNNRVYGIYVASRSAIVLGDVVVSNSIITYNSSTAIRSVSGKTLVANCLVANNSEGLNGHFNVENTSILNNAGWGVDNGYNNVILNSIIWGNSIASIPSNLSNNIICTYSAIEGGYEGEGNISLDDVCNRPMFVNPSLTPGAADSTPNVDWHLQSGSVCINRGNNNAVTDNEHNTIDARVVNNQLVLHVDAAAPDMIDVILYGINGQLLLTQHYGSTDQVNDILPFQYSNGLYLLIVRVGNQVYPVKLLKY